MRVLLDNNVNYRFGRLLAGHDVVHVQDIGWEDLKNGDLILAAEEHNYDVIITADKSMRHQQTIENRRIAVFVLNSLFLKWKFIEPLAPQVKKALNRVQPGTYIIIDSEQEV